MPRESNELKDAKRGFKIQAYHFNKSYMEICKYNEYNIDSGSIKTVKGLIQELQSCYCKIIEHKIIIEELSEEQLIDTFHEQLIECKTNVDVWESKVANSLETKNKIKTNSDLNIKLPTIKLIEFEGDFMKWLPFWDTFETLIHKNESLSEVEKLQYLKSAVKGEAAVALNNISIIGKNYNIAIEILKQRFENKRIIIKHNMNGLFSLPSVHINSASSYRKLYDEAIIHLNALEALGLPTSSWDLIIIHLIIEKFDTKTKGEWESLANDIPTLAELEAFIIKKSQTIEILNLDRCDKDKKRTNVATAINKCSYCKKNNHLIQFCNHFQNLSIDDKINFVKNAKLCYNCLDNNHWTLKCQKSGCKKCNKKHATLLHKEQSKTNINTSEPSTSKFSENEKTSHMANKIQSGEVLLSTAVVLIKNHRGQFKEYRALLDMGSQSSFITDEALKQLGIKGTKGNYPITGISGQGVNINKSVNVTLKSRNQNFSKNIQCLVLPQITSKLPSIRINYASFKIPSGIELADPQFHTPDDIQLLLGADIFWQLMQTGCRSLGKNKPYLQNTKLGWIVGGKIDNYNINTNAKVNLSLKEIDLNIKSIFEVDNLDNNKSENEVVEDLECEKYYLNTYTRLDNGRFCVKLPFKNTTFKLGESKSLALKRFYKLENKLNKDLPLKSQYNKFLNEFIDQGHMELYQNPDDSDPTKHFYLPHHAVLKDSSLTTKLRVVFDCSMKSSNNVSLNDILLRGPNLQLDLFDILVRFRTFPIVITADIKQMYRQIRINEQDRDYHRILWRESNNQKVQTYRLNTVTFGTICGPYLAIKTLRQLAKIEQENYPLAANIINRDFYMDDVITGTNTIEEANILIKQLTDLLGKGKFELNKWASNREEIIPTEIEKFTIRNLNEDGITKMLGLLWDSNRDCLFFNVDNTKLKEITVTKRNILSTIAQIYDPLGLVGPIITKGKILLQRLWQEKLDWDDNPSFDIINLWVEFIRDLESMQNIKIPRLVFNDKILNLYGYCDASKSAYGACIYVINKTLNSSQLLCSKSRVAPVKPLTIPRLELLAAVLLAKLMERVTQSISYKFEEIILHSDSKIVLAWLKTEPQLLKVYVSNRIIDIKKSSKNMKWRYIQSQHNPADVISRGSSTPCFDKNSIWWQGPPLGTDKDEEVITISELPEMKANTCFVTEKCNEITFIHKFGSFPKLVRIMAWVNRFIAHTLKRDSCKNDHLSATEISKATIGIIKIVQRESFKRELDMLKSNKPVNIFKSLSPFLDKNDTLRVGGRLDNARNLNYNQKYPILLPKGHFVTQLIIRDMHENLCHAGPENTLSHLRQKYWPIAGRSTVRQVIHKCIKCFKVNPTSTQPIMGNLPSYRIEPQIRPFLHVGVDYAGPIILSNDRGRTKSVVKSYIVLFVCMTTKAVHVDLVKNCSSDTFMNTLKRFIARRGKPIKIYSDNGTTFVGANREMRELYQLFKDQKFYSDIIIKLADQLIEWEFIPPRSPNFGGIWEAGIKSVKSHLKRTIGNEKLKFEELYTLLTQIESVLNSRPLTPISSDASDLTVLTPGHFLIGQALTEVPEPNLENVTRLSRWQHLTRIRQSFWRKWQVEYLHNLQQRHKWMKGSKEPKIGDLVLIKDEKTPPMVWAKGRIIAVHPGNDGVIRVVTLKTENGQLKRALNKVCLLPIDNDIDSV